MRRPYFAENCIKPGTGVVQGSEENKVAAPDGEGAGDFIGVYAFEANEPKKSGETVGIAISGVVKVRSGGTVSAGKKAILKADDSGTFIQMGDAPGIYSTCGTFLQSGVEDEYVDMIVERTSVTIADTE
jgi:hypothetical protein